MCYNHDPIRVLVEGELQEQNRLIDGCTMMFSMRSVNKPFVTESV